MEDILFSFYNVFWLFIWFNTEAFIEYFKYIPFLNNSFKIKNYYKYQSTGGNLTYPVFLQVNYNNFGTRLISCPYCLLFWINLSSLFFIDNLISFFINYIISMILYCVMMIIIKKYER
jgi:hypothetical protein